MKNEMMASLQQRIEKALDEIRPFLQADDGDVKLLEITDQMVARIELLGACSTCNLSHLTMRAGLEDIILRAAPEIKAVVTVNEL
jgi:Fe-S cluster biogenesis protein NfuA